MADRSITFFPVGNGNCCLIEIDDLRIAIDLKGTDKAAAYELLKPHLSEEDGRKRLDVLCITHGDGDHCAGFGEMKKEMDKGRLIIGTIWHPNFDRTKVDDDSELPEDYKALHAEIMRRRSIKNPQFGDLEQPLTAWDTERKAFEGFDEIPEQLSLHVLSPYLKDDETGDLDINNLCLVLNIEVSGLKVLFPGDSGSPVWQDRIFPHTLHSDDKSEWAKSDILLVSHHGSWKFFGRTTREDVLDADPTPENYEALDYIKFNDLVVSASSRFPTARDQSGDLPPHYAAWKWYHHWARKNLSVSEDDKHPDCFRYTANGHLRLEYGDNGWEWVTDWSPDDDGNGSGAGGTESGTQRKSTGFKYREKEDTRRGPGHYA